MAQFKNKEEYEKWKVGRGRAAKETPANPVTPETGKSDDPIKCPKCGSSQFLADKKGFSLGKAVAGDVLLGPVGLLGGMLGAKKVRLTCLKCGCTWKPGQTTVATKEIQTLTNPASGKSNGWLGLISGIFLVLIGCLILVQCMIQIESSKISAVVLGFGLTFSGIFVSYLSLKHRTPHAK